MPIGSHDIQLGNWSPNWEGSIIVSKVLENGSYRITEIDGKELNTSINEKYVKYYYPSIQAET